MAQESAVEGINCPKCGGMVPIPEGQIVVQCPFCDLRSMVKGEHGVRRYQVPEQIKREQALGAMQHFFGNWAIARDVRTKAQLTESFVTYLPFWALWGRALGWAFGEKKVGSGDDARYEPREIRIAEDLTWTGAACDVGEFGVQSIPLTGRPLGPFDGEALHSRGMVFEPVGSMSDAHTAAQSDFEQRVRSKANLDRLAQLFVRFVRERFGLVYYPLWVMRYLYRGRAFQVVVDGFDGKVLYGKAPGNTLYRAAVLVGGLALGALLAVDVPALVIASSSNSDNNFSFAIIMFLVGLSLMGLAYRKFRYGEQYEYGRPKKDELSSLISGNTEQLKQAFNLLKELQ